MKKRIIIIILCLLMLVSVLPVSAGADVSINFVSINDTLPPELINSFFSYSGVVYVPCWLFNSYDFGVRYTFIDANSTIHLYYGTTQLFFETATGNTYDGSDNYYSLPGLMRNGVAYVPLSYVSAFFGTFSYTVSSTPYGRLLRITDGRVVLSDNDFIQAASSLMRQYYNNYQPASPDPSPVLPDGEDKHEDDVLLLSFVGLPGDEYFELLRSRGMRACFFLTAEDVRSSPDTLRRITYEGHSIGIACGETPEADIRRASELIFEASHSLANMVSASAEHAGTAAAAAEKLGYAFCERGTDAVYAPEDAVSPYAVTSELDRTEDSTSLFLSCAEGMEDMARIVLDYVERSGFEVRPPNEILR